MVFQRTALLDTWPTTAACGIVGDGGVPMRRLMPMVIAALLVVGAVTVAVWTVPYAATARSLYLFERETPTDLVSGSASQGVGRLGLDVVTLDDGRVVEVYRHGEPRVQWPRPEFLVGEHGARLADEPPSSGAWWPFALRALVGWIGTLLVLAVSTPWLVRRLPPAVQHLGFVIFGQRDPETRPVTWVPGGGGYGSGGGQVPPLVPYNPDWDPDRRIR
jgi:hypothetical protein